MTKILFSNLRPIIDEIATETSERHKRASKKALKLYVSDAGSSKRGAIKFLEQTRDRCEKFGFPVSNLDSIEFERFSKHVWGHIDEEQKKMTADIRSVLEDEQINIPASIEHYKDVIIEYCMRPPVKTAADFLYTESQKIIKGNSHTFTVVLVRFESEAQYTSAIRTLRSKDKGFFGEYRAASCDFPVSKRARLEAALQGMDMAAQEINNNIATFIPGLENWTNEHINIRDLVRRWYVSSQTRPNAPHVVFLPYFGSLGASSPHIDVLLELCKIGKGKFYLPHYYIESPKPAFDLELESNDWDEIFMGFSERIKPDAERVAAAVLCEVQDVLKTKLPPPLADALESITPDTKLKIRKYLVQKALLEKNAWGIDRQYKEARTALFCEITKEMTPSFSTTAGIDPVSFFDNHFRKWFVFFRLPKRSLNKVAPSLIASITRGKSKNKLHDLKI